MLAALTGLALGSAHAAAGGASPAVAMLCLLLVQRHPDLRKISYYFHGDEFEGFTPRLQSRVAQAVLDEVLSVYPRESWTAAYGSAGTVGAVVDVLVAAYDEDIQLRDVGVTIAASPLSAAVGLGALVYLR